MFETSGADGEGHRPTPPPPAADRLWRHPSEIALERVAAAPATKRTDHRSPRFSLGTVVVAGSLGALVMFGSLAATGLVGGSASPTDDAAGTVAGLGDPEATTTVPNGIVPVRLDDAGHTTFGAGIVFNTGGDIVTTLAPATSGATGTTLSVATSETTWAGAQVLGSDPTTGLTVLRPSSAALMSTGRRTPPATTATAALGGSVDLVRPGSSGLDPRVRVGAPTRVTSTNATLATSTVQLVGLVTLTSARPASASEVGVDAETGSIAALVVPADDNVEDEMAYAVPAELAVSVARQIEQTGRARHGTLGVGLAETSDRRLLVDRPSPSSGLAVGDELLAVRGRPVHQDADVLGALLGVTPGEPVAVTVRRSGRQLTVDTVAVSRDGEPASSTTTP